MTGTTPSTDRPPLLAAGSMALAFVACNGAFVAVALAAALGVTLTINPHVQAAVISLFSLATVFFVYRGFRSHRTIGPQLIAILGAMLVVGTMYISFNKIVESIGLALLLAGVIWGWRARKAA